MRRLALVCLLLTGCTASGTVGLASTETPSPSVTSASPSPSPQVREIVVSVEEVAGVKMGTPADAAERQLREAFGPPTSTRAIPDCAGEHGRSLTWGTLSVILSDGADGGPIELYGWSVVRGTAAFTYALPFGVALGDPIRDVAGRVPAGAGGVADEGPNTGSYVVHTTEHPYLFWMANTTGSSEVVDDISYRDHGCD